MASIMDLDNKKALDGVKQILSVLTNQDLFNLAATTTERLLGNKIGTREGAVEVILKYSRDYQSILKRKVITRELLFTYLHENNVRVTLPATKNDLITVVCLYWELKSPEVVSPILQQTVNDNSTTNSPQPVDVNTLAIKFSEWFYSMMNMNQPIGSEHFWNDSKLELNLISATQSQTETIHDNPEEIVTKLFKTKIEHALYFNPNLLNNGTQGRMDLHGLVMVLACGTLHSNNICVGVFEQIFHLMRDPFSNNNWKIKNTQIYLKSKNDVQSLPRLCDSNLML